MQFSGPCLKPCLSLPGTGRSGCNESSQKHLTCLPFLLSADSRLLSLRAGKEMWMGSLLLIGPPSLLQVLTEGLQAVFNGQPERLGCSPGGRNVLMLA